MKFGGNGGEIIIDLEWTTLDDTGITVPGIFNKIKSALENGKNVRCIKFKLTSEDYSESDGYSIFSTSLAVDTANGQFIAFATGCRDSNGYFPALIITNADVIRNGETANF